MEIIFATKNKSKIKHLQDMLENTKFDVIGIEDLNLDLVEPVENGDTPLENATLKALEYYKQIKRPVYSTDCALFFEGVEEEDQPGVLIKRIHGKDLSGLEFRDYYMKIAKKYGGKVKAYYKNAICVVFSEDNIVKYDGRDISSEDFYIVDKPHSFFEEGYPLNSLSVHIESGKYYNDMKDYKAKGSMDEGFVRFFKSLA